MSTQSDAEQKLLQLLSGKWVTAAIAAAAELGIADALAAAPLTAAQLAERLGCDQLALTRLLRVLCGEGLLEAQIDGNYELTPVGAQLSSGQLRDLARFVGAPFMWTPWAELAHALRDTQRSAFERAHGHALFQHLDARPQDAAVYHHAVDAFTRRQARALCDAFDFSGLSRVVDVGGGLGTVLTELSTRFPQLACVLYDRPSVVEQARGVWANTRPDLRSLHIEAESGDFFERVPQPADAYIVKHVLHNWDDAHATQILRVCREALRPGGHVLIVESLLLPGNVRDATALLDLEMLVLCGTGHERSKPQFRRLLRSAGLRLQATRALAGGARLLIAAPYAAEA
jgi:SAM-dependent methyltransferase